MQSKAAKIKAARERLAEAKALQSAHVSKNVGKVAAGNKAEGILARLRRKAMIVVKTTGAAAPEHGDVTGFGIGYGFTGDGFGTVKNEKNIRAALEAGTLKVTMPGGGSISVAPSTAVQRTRIVSPSNARVVLAAQKAVNRAAEKLTQARRALAQAESDAFDAGSKPEPKVLFSTIAQVVTAKSAMYRGSFDNDEWEQKRDASAITEAEGHLARMKSGEPCGCNPCTREKQDAEQLAANIARLAAMPRRKVPCPDHGIVLMPWERAERNLTPERAKELGFESWGIHVVPIAYCTKAGSGAYPNHSAFILTDTLKADQAVAAPVPGQTTIAA